MLYVVIKCIVYTFTYNMYTVKFFGFDLAVSCVFPYMESRVRESANVIVFDSENYRMHVR